jgi:hypothetical protein
MGQLEGCGLSGEALEHDLVQFIKYIVEGPAE